MKKRRKNDWRPGYDMMMIEQYRKEHPEMIAQMEAEVLEQNPKMNKKNLKAKINRMILPPVLERAESDSTWDGNDVLPLSQVLENTITRKLA